MSKSYNDLLSMEFIPLSEAKATLSEQVRKTVGGAKRIAITCNGKPAAVVLSYRDYLDLIRQLPSQERQRPERIINLNDWKKGEKNRLKVRDSILGLFNPATLSRKGQKAYKRNKVREFDQKS